MGASINLSNTGNRRAKYVQALVPLIRPVLSIVLTLGLSAIASAQVHLPGVQMPNQPTIPLPVNVQDPIGVVTQTLDSTRLKDLRILRIRELLRANPRELETDPKGAPIIRREIVAYAPNEVSLRLAREAGFVIIRESLLPALEINIVVLAPRAGMTTRSALKRLRRLDPSGSYDFNHVYVESGVMGDTVEEAPLSHSSHIQKKNISNVGLIDTGVDFHHPSLSKSSLHQWGCESKSIPRMHGTAVASLLVGNSANFLGAAPGASLYAADVYCGKATGGAVDGIVNAFAWLAQEKVPVINVSLVGPRNVLLEKTVAAMLARGHIIVAAVGNDGPAAPPLYPAAYDGVIGVTGVDERRRVLLEAERGAQVDFSAPGADMAAANLSNGYIAVRGTSFAAPIVAGLLAQRLMTPHHLNAKKIVDALSKEGIDLGPRGADEIYGQGLVGEAVRVAPKMLAHPK